MSNVNNVKCQQCKKRKKERDLRKIKIATYFKDIQESEWENCQQSEDMNEEHETQEKR